MNKHIVFDLDGTLADTQRIHQKIESDFLASMGVNIDPNFIGKTYAGRSPIEWLPEKLQESSIDFSLSEVAAFIASKDKIVIDLLKKGDISLMPGVETTLGVLTQRGYKLGISSGACREFIDAFIEYFNLVMIVASTSADEVTHKKPAPDVFLATFDKLENMHGSADEKWVVGDGKSDIIGGNAAGAKTILCYNQFDAPYSFQISNFLEISTILQDRFPQIGSRWRHYKSDGTELHTYEVIGIAVHSEAEESMVLYRPLYPVGPESWAYGYDYVTRPLSLWYDIVEYNGQKIQRFTEIFQ